MDYLYAHLDGGSASSSWLHNGPATSGRIVGRSVSEFFTRSVCCSVCQGSGPRQLRVGTGQGGLLTFLLSLSSNSVCMWCVYRHFNKHCMSRDGSARPRYLICNALPGCWINSLLNIAPLLPGSWSSGDRAWKPNFGCPQGSMPRRFVRGESRFWDPGSRPAGHGQQCRMHRAGVLGGRHGDSDMVCLFVITDKGGSKGSRPGASKCWFDGLVCPVTVA